MWCISFSCLAQQPLPVRPAYTNNEFDYPIDLLIILSRAVLYCPYEIWTHDGCKYL